MSGFLNTLLAQGPTGAGGSTEVEYTITVGERLGGGRYGYESLGLSFGSIVPDPPEFGSVTILNIQYFTSGADFLITFDTFTTISQVVVEQVGGGTFETLDAADAVIDEGAGTYSWSGTSVGWNNTIIGQDRTVTISE